MRAASLITVLGCGAGGLAVSYDPAFGEQLLPAVICAIQGERGIRGKGTRIGHLPSTQIEAAFRRN